MREISINAKAKQVVLRKSRREFKHHRNIKLQSLSINEAKSFNIQDINAATALGSLLSSPYNHVYSLVIFLIFPLYLFATSKYCFYME